MWYLGEDPGEKWDLNPGISSDVVTVSSCLKSFDKVEQNCSQLTRLEIYSKMIKEKAFSNI